LCSVYLNVPYYKDEGKTWNSKVPDQQLWDYNNKDAIYTLWIAKQIQNLLHEKNLWSKYEDLLRGSLEIALEMQRTRLRRSYHESQTIQSILKDEIQTAHGEVKRLAQREINVVSPKQVGDLLFHDMGLAQPRGYGSGRDPSTDENQLKLLYAKTQEPVLSAIIKERHLRKRWSSYIDIIDDPDGYLPFGVNVAGTESGRWSMKKSVRDRGFNAQTCPKIMRWAYCPPPGRIYLQPDLSQAEARVVAWLSECQPLIDIFLDPRRNIHSEIAALVFGHEVEKDSLEYTLAKSMVHASNYRMGAGRFAAETGLSYAKAAKLLEAFHARFPEIRKWHDSIRKRVVETGRLVTPTGRNRTFYDALGAIVARGKMNDNLWREAISYIPQATVADLTNQGMQAAWRELGNGALFHNQSHDSFLLSVRPDQVGKAARIIQRSLHLPLTIHGRELIIPSDLAIGYNWYMLKQYEGEESYHYGDWKRWENKEWQRHAIKTGGSRSKYIAAQLSGIY
jgi:DNA polymerase-1